MRPRLLGLIALGTAPIVAAQETTSATSSASPTVSSSGEITIHTITVGKVENQFEPNSLNATPGDIVRFQFYPSNHSVIKAAYGTLGSDSVVSRYGPDADRLSMCTVRGRHWRIWLVSNTCFDLCHGAKTDTPAAGPAGSP
jgi:plastocyanin